MFEAAHNSLLRSARSIQEFQIDLLLREEFSVEPEFAREFLLACGSRLHFKQVEKIIHSLNDSYGEADLFVQLATIDDTGKPVRLVLLIEDKINAAFQPRQALRYRERGEAGLQATSGNGNAWDSFLTVLVAPAAFIGEEHGFDAAIPLENVKDWLCRGEPGRRAYKSAQIEEAIAKKSASGVQRVDAAMTSFRKAYFSHLRGFNERRGTDFSMRNPADTYFGDYWFILKSRTLPGNAEFRHMAPSGNVELSFKETLYDQCTEVASLLEPDMQMVQTGKYMQHVTLRLSAPKIPVFDDFARDQHKVEAALLGAERLLRLFQREHAHIERIVVAARAPLAARPA